jgi:hypothetical protein
VRAGKEHAVSNAARLGLGGAAIVVAVVLFIVLSDGGDDSSTTTTTAESGKAAGTVPTIQIKDAKPLGGIQDLSVTKGDPIRFEVDSDTAGDVHLHGYEIEKPVEKGGTASFDVPSTLDGKFEIELHIGGSETNAVQIGELTVTP